jgi:hypothetical protein
MSVANDVSPPMTIAGHAFEVKERGGGVLHLRIALHGGSVAELALRLRVLEGVRVTKGPDGVAGCYIVHCEGFKIVLSADKKDDSALALVSPTQMGTAPMSTSELSLLLEALVKKPLPRPGDTSPWRKGFTFGKVSAEPPRADGAKSPLPRRGATLAPGKPLSRKAPLMRKTPLGRRGTKRG